MFDVFGLSGTADSVADRFRLAAPGDVAITNALRVGFFAMQSAFDGAHFGFPHAGLIGTAEFGGAFDVGVLAAGTTRNLVLNGDAESGPWATDFATAVDFPSGWGSRIGGFTTVTYAAGAGDINALHSDAADPNGGGVAYFAGGPNSAQSSISQRISIGGFASAIDAGSVTLNLSYDLGGYSTQDDHMNITVSFKNSAFVTLDSLNVAGPVAADRGNVSQLLHESNSDLVPVGTRYIEITLTSTRVGAGTYNDGYADNISVTLSGEGVSGGAIEVKSNHDYHHASLGYVTGVAFATTHDGVTAIFSSEQFESASGDTLVIAGDQYANTLAIQVGPSHTFAPHVIMPSWSPAQGDIVTITGTSANDVIHDMLFDDIIHTGDGDDSITIGSGDDTVFAENGNDIIIAYAGYSGRFDANDAIDGGTGNDTLELMATASPSPVLLGDTTLKNIETVVLDDTGFNYDITFADGNVAAGGHLLLDASALTSTESAVLNLSKETNGTISFVGGDGIDTLTGGAKHDTLQGGLGGDHLNGGGGPDSFVYGDVSESTSSVFDIVDKFDANRDVIDISAMGVAIHAVDPAIAAGKLTAGNFDPNLAHAVNAHKLHANDAVLFTPSTGTPSFVGNTFLIIDINGVAGYQSDQDLVIEFTQPLHLGSFNTADIIT
jgi:Ca2+-binding RTX toxin-like protein